ncbi:tRNA glutamyl-Q(34) synthetase GluQRS [Neptunicella marina]|uniref:Glutamyl-Q tRNA(Asp) synthetase n=1 Tax=Neptunicella marina TaxID=2125989 RepID=A0A8J6IUR9_9ALTE|nr:tRNA glutamyl-Q(34) synthetase GluQRS [Neptunicella marina]MBC3766008.1 tRNA glutamyl-Q(34) synthetase GluQRS [Neptunicella marina]
MKNSPSTYRGRFAPSPSGPLHLGSLVAAVGSYLHAKSHQGKWLVRIEDIDPPREMPGATDIILHTLEQHGLYWDEAIRYQSKQSDLYEYHLELLQKQSVTYYCNCTRKLIQQRGGHYHGYCRDRHLTAEGCSLRFKNLAPINYFTDMLQGNIAADQAFSHEDFILKRKDGLYAYHLAVVSDDTDQQINHIVRGSDLLQPTACQLALYQQLKLPQPQYLHLPVVVTKPGLKLSKQNHAPALDNNRATDNLCTVLSWLNHAPPADIANTDCEHILKWASANWLTSKLPQQIEILKAQG